MFFLRWLHYQAYSAFVVTTVLSKALVLWFECLFLPTRYFSYNRRKPKHAPVFIVGCGHSGTSLLLALVGTHSSFCAVPGESNLAYDYDNRRVRVGSLRSALLLRYFDLLTISRRRQRWVEKTPKHVYSIPELRRLVPGCRFLVILRDGRDVACSIEARYGNLEKGIERWVDDNRAAEPFWHDADVHVMKYEDLIVNLRGTMETVFAFLGEKFEEGVLRSHEKPKYYYSRKIQKPPDQSQKYHDQYRNWQINQELFDGRGKWHELPPEARAMIKRHAGRMLIDYGYATDENW